VGFAVIFYTYFYIIAWICWILENVLTIFPHFGIVLAAVYRHLKVFYLFFLFVKSQALGGIHVYILHRLIITRSLNRVDKEAHICQHLPFAHTVRSPVTLALLPRPFTALKPKRPLNLCDLRWQLSPNGFQSSISI